MITVELTFSESNHAINIISKRFEDLSGDLGLQVLSVKLAIEDAFKAYHEKVKAQTKKFRELSESYKEAEGPARKSIRAEMDAIEADLEALAGKTEQIELPKGQLSYRELRKKGYDQYGVLDGLRPLIDFGDKEL